jgi:hypothetical protein
MAAKAEICVSARRHKILLDDNNRYQKDREYKNKTYWKCVDYKSGCKARLHTVGGKLKLHAFEERIGR